MSQSRSKLTGSRFSFPAVVRPVPITLLPCVLRQLSRDFGKGGFRIAVLSPAQPGLRPIKLLRGARIHAAAPWISKRFRHASLSPISEVVEAISACWSYPSSSSLGFVVQDHVQQGIMNFQRSIVFDIAQFAEFVHEVAHA
jgi:hypothetical protein